MECLRLIALQNHLPSPKLGLLRRESHQSRIPTDKCLLIRYPNYLGRRRQTGSSSGNLSQTLGYLRH